MVETASSTSQRTRAKVRVPISWKLLGATVVVGAIATGIAIHGMRRMNALNERLTELIDYSAAKVTLAALLKQDLITITRAENNLIVARSDDEIQRYGDSIDDSLSAMKDHQDRLAELVDEKDRLQLAAFEREWLEWQKVHREVRNFAQLKSNVRARELALGKSREAYEKLESALTVLSAKSLKQAESSNAVTGESQLTSLLQRMNRISLIAVDAAKIQRIEKQMMLADDEQELREYTDLFIPIEADVQVQLKQLEGLLGQAEQTDLAHTRVAFQEYVDLLREMRTILAEKGNFIIYQFVHELGSPFANKAEQMLNDIIARNEADLKTSREESRQTYITSRNALLGFSTLGIVISVLVTYFTGQRIALNLTQLAEYAHTVETTRDLSRPVPRVSQDEVGVLAESFDQLRQSLHRQNSELSAVNQTLERKNHEMELTQEKLESYAVDLERSNEHLKNFAHTVAHEVKSPLGVVATCLQLLADKHGSRFDGQAQEMVQDASSSIRGLSDLVNELLEFARVGSEDQDFATVEMEAVFYQVVALLRPTIRTTQTRLTHDPLPAVRGNEVQLRQLLQNLIGNAIKYRGDEPPAIHVSAREETEEWVFSVRDNGLGIPEDLQTQIFEAFVRVHRPSEIPGTGIGLAFCTRIVEHHSGRIWVESSPGKGSTFYFTLSKASLD
jgi:signal transduction histidine kinase